MNFAASLFHPSQPGPAPCVEDIAAAYYASVVTKVELACRKAGLELDGLDLDPEDSCAVGLMCWTAELGAAHELSRGPMALPGMAAAQVALCNARLGKALDLELALTPAVGLIFAGMPLPRADRLRIRSSEDEVHLRVGEKALVFRREGGRLVLLDRPTVLRTFISPRDVIVTGGSCGDVAISNASDIAIGSDVFPRAVENVGQAFEFISEVAPEYGPWTRLIRQVHLFSSGFGDDWQRHAGRSSPWRPGYIVATAPATVSLQAETLIHESSHQYFYMMQMLSPVGTQEAAGLELTSPLNGKRREISRYMLAYHAVANMIMFHAKALEKQVDDRSVVQERLRYLRPIALQYLEDLDAHRDVLSEPANDFWSASSGLVRKLCNVG